MTLIEKKIEKLLSRLDILEVELGQPGAFADKSKYKKLTQEHAYLTQVKSHWEELHKVTNEITGNEELLANENDPEFLNIIKDDVAALKNRQETLNTELESLLIPPDPNDHRNTIIELRAGTGGDEAALFVGDCVRMYKLFADRMGWRYELLSCTESEIGGYKEYVMVLSGPNVYRMLRYEGGAHRVQRVPDTEAQGRVHTSAITIAVLMEPDEDTEVKIDEKDLRVDTYRSSGAGGQHVNTTDSAVRLTHLPTGIVVYCQEERSQHKNKEKAMRLLAAKITEVEQEKKMSEIASNRSQQVGSGDRSERIRTYNFPQNRVTEHRINLTKYSLDRIMNGDLLEIIPPLVAHFYQQQLAGE